MNFLARIQEDVNRLLDAPDVAEPPAAMGPAPAAQAVHEVAVGILAQAAGAFFGALVAPREPLYSCPTFAG